MSRLAIVYLCLAAWLAQAAEPPCAALYCPGGDVSIQAFMALAEERLCRGKAVRVLDRANFSQVLEEHRLSLAGLTAPEAALRTGRLLKADLVVALEMDSEENTPYGVVIYDTKLGRRLVDRGLPPGKPEALAAMLAAEVEVAAAKIRQTPKGATALCVMPVRPAGLPNSLGYLPRAVHVLLQRSLAGNPELALLERSHLGLRNGDTPLPDQGLLRPTLSLELELAKGAVDGGVVARGHLTAADGERLASLEVASSKAAPEAVVAALLPELDRALRLKGSTAGLDPEAESARFKQEARVLLNCNEFPAALAAAESACALASADGRAAVLGGKQPIGAQDLFFLLDCSALPDTVAAVKNASPLIRSEELVATLGGCQLAEATRLLDGDLATKPTAQLDRAFTLATAAVRARLDDIPGTGRSSHGLPARSYWYHKCGSWRFWHSVNLRLEPLVKAARQAEDEGLGSPGPRRAFLEIVRAQIFSVLDSPMDLAVLDEVDLHLFALQNIFAKDVRDKLELLRRLEPGSPRLPADACLLLDNFADSCAKHGVTFFTVYERLLKTSPGTKNTPGTNIQTVLGPAFKTIYRDYYAGGFSLADQSHPYVKFIDKCRRHPLELFRVYAAGMDLRADLRQGGIGVDEALERFFTACGKMLDERGQGPVANVPRGDFYVAVVEALKDVQPTERRYIDPRAEALELMVRRKELCGDLIPEWIDWTWSITRKQELIARLTLALDAPGVKLEAHLPLGENLRHALQSLALAYGAPVSTGPDTRLSRIWARRQVLGEGREFWGTRAGGLAFAGRWIYLLRRVGDEREATHSYKILRAEIDGGPFVCVAETESGGSGENCSCVPPFGVVGGGFYFAPTRDFGVCVYGLEDGQLRMFNTKSGLPANRTNAAAYLDGWLYTGMSSSNGGFSFLKINPLSGNYTVLGASGARGDGAPLGAAARPAWIGSMAASPLTKRVFLTMDEQRSPFGYHKGGESRLFEYATDTGRFKVLSERFVGDLIRPRPFEGSYFFRNDRTNAATFHCLATGATLPVYDYPQPDICSSPPPVALPAAGVNPKLLNFPPFFGQQPR